MTLNVNPEGAPKIPVLERFVFPQPHRLISMNDRDHWRQRSRRVKAWRAATHGAVAARRPGASRWIAAGQSLPPGIVHVQLPVPDSRRRDPHNYYPTIKAIVDGLVDAGLWPDDTPEWVTTTEPTLVVDRPDKLAGQPSVVITIRPRPAAIADDELDRLAKMLGLLP